MKGILINTVLIISIIGCNLRKEANQDSFSTSQSFAPDLLSDTASFPRIYEYKNGDIELNGISADIHRVEQKIKEVSTRGTVIFYASETPSEDPREGLVSNLFKKYKVSIKTYTDKTFTKSYY